MGTFFLSIDRQGTNTLFFDELSLKCKLEKGHTRDTCECFVEFT